MRVAIAAGLCALVLAAYANSFSAGFALDSRQLVLNDTRVHAVTAAEIPRARWFARISVQPPSKR